MLTRKLLVHLDPLVGSQFITQFVNGTISACGFCGVQIFCSLGVYYILHLSKDYEKEQPTLTVEAQWEVCISHSARWGWTALI